MRTTIDHHPYKEPDLKLDQFEISDTTDDYGLKCHISPFYRLGPPINSCEILGLIDEERSEFIDSFQI